MRRRGRYALVLLGISALAGGVVGVGLALAAAPIRATTHATRRVAAHATKSGLGGTVVLTRGNLTIRVSHEPNGHVCLVEESPTEASGGACGTATEVAERGIIDLSEEQGRPTRLTVLVPTGVSNITVVANDKEAQIAPINNVATMTVEKFKEVEYQLPNGARVKFAPPPAISRYPIG